MPFTGKHIVSHDNVVQSYTFYCRDIPWSSPSELYPAVTPILNVVEYRLDLLTGIITSAGGLTETLVSEPSWVKIK